MIDARAILGTHDVLMITLDTLRHDVAAACMREGRTPNFKALVPGGMWEERHTPASFTYAAHHAFFAGFLPTPTAPGRHERLFAARFAGSETTTERTLVFDSADIVTGFAQHGYRTVCVGGVGFFNKLTPLGSVLPGLFGESHWSPELGVTNPASTQRQFALAAEVLAQTPADKRVFLFINVSALHQPNKFYVPGAQQDSLETHAAALAYVDECLPVLMEAVAKRGPTLAVICSDHGTAYGDDGYHGHRFAHPCVWTVPYAEMIIGSRGKT